MEMSEVLGGTLVEVPEVLDEIFTGVSEVHVGILTDVSEAYDVIHCQELPKLLLCLISSNLFYNFTM